MWRNTANTTALLLQRNYYHHAFSSTWQKVFSTRTKTNLCLGLAGAGVAASILWGVSSSSSHILLLREEPNKKERDDDHHDSSQILLLQKLRKKKKGHEHKHDDDNFVIDRTTSFPFVLPKVVFRTLLPSSIDMIKKVATTTTKCDGSSSSSSSLPTFRTARFRKRKTTEMMEEMTETIKTFHSQYNVNYAKPLGEGAYGAVYYAQHITTREDVAVKRLSKSITDNIQFQREMEALILLKKHGGHPNICGLRENYEENDHYLVVLDLVGGGEMFDHLIRNGAYSEADAARLIREVASALAFLHGIGIVHADLKPENLMLSSEVSSAAVIKVVDFGSAQVLKQQQQGNSNHHEHTTSRKGASFTAAYCPPEFLEKRWEALRNRSNNKLRRLPPLQPAFDMWALGVILYIMLTGIHPFDLYNDAGDDEVVRRILAGQAPPLRNSPFTAHLSADALAVIERLLQWDPDKRYTAQQLLHDPWVRGDTARTNKIADSDKRLSAYHAFKTKLEAKIFADMVSLNNDSDGGEESGVTKRMSLIERAFHKMDPTRRGYVTAKDLRLIVATERQQQQQQDVEEVAATAATAAASSATVGEEDRLSLSGFSELLSENMKNRYFPEGHVIYEEGDIGDVMYFINSGSVQVYTRGGFHKTLSRGTFMGEGALLHRKKTRSASAQCVTPVHAIEISREYFEKYLASEEDVRLHLRETDRARRDQNVNNTILGLQQSMKQKDFSKGDVIFQQGEEGTELYIVEEGKVDASVDDGNVVLSLRSGEIIGEHALVFGRPRNITTTCESPQCRLHMLRADDFHTLLEANPSLKEIIRETCLRRDFQKALCATTKRGFPRHKRELRVAFNEIANESGVISMEGVRSMILKFDPDYTEQDLDDMMKSIDLDGSGSIGWNKFRRIFGLNNKS